MTTSELPNGAELVRAIAMPGNDLPGIWTLIGMEDAVIGDGTIQI